MNTVTGVGVLDKGVAILDICERRPSTQTDIARTLGLSVPTVHRLTAALVAHGFLFRDDEDRFHLGPRFLHSRLAELVQPVLQRLTAEISETSQVWVARGTNRVCVASVIADAELRVALPAGSSLPLSAGGSAVPALAGEVPEGGWTESISRRTVGVGSVSAPVMVGDVAVAAVCVLAPLPRVPTTPGEMYGARTVSAAAEIAALLV